MTILIVLTACQPRPEQDVDAEQPPIIEVASRSEVVSESASPEDVTRALIVALGTDRPDHANALFESTPTAGFVEGIDDWNDLRSLRISPSEQVDVESIIHGLPDNEGTARLQRELERYEVIVRVDATLSQVASSARPVVVDLMTCYLGRIAGDSRWYVVFASTPESASPE